jgi:hypothetical protein
MAQCLHLCPSHLHSYVHHEIISRQ